MQLDPESANVICCYGTVLLKEGQIPEAIRYLENAVLRDPDLYLAHHNLSVCYQSTGDYKKYYYHEKELYRLKPNIRKCDCLWSSDGSRMGCTARIPFLAHSSDGSAE